VRDRFCALLACLAMLMPAVAADAQEQAAFPNRTLRIVVPYPPGGSTDASVRVLVPDLTERLRQPVVIESKPGAAGSIGTDFVAKSPADGYTLLFHTSVITTDPSFKKNLTYDVVRDLTPLTLAASGPYLLVVNSSLPVTSVAELIAYAKANPGKLNYGSAGQGSSGHLIGEMFKLAAGIDMVHVPYRGGAPSIIGLMGNEVQLVFDVISTSRELADAGKLRALAVTSPQRSPAMPAVPTMAESGLKGFEPVFWLGVFGPANMPPAIVDKLHGAFAETLANQAVRDKLRTYGLVTHATAPAEFSKVVADDIRKWKQVIDDAKITPP
jgi:tripartite-type tricarboxylate transporter receptor subunit TctC